MWPGLALVAYSPEPLGLHLGNLGGHVMPVVELGLTTCKAYAINSVLPLRISFGFLNIIDS